MSGRASNRWVALSVVSGVISVGIAAAGAWRGNWILTALPIGYLFGFFLEKSDLCGASALSEVIVLRDCRKLGGFAVAIAVSMLGFALISILGLIDLNPKPLLWANILLGGAVFGVGIVLAGGCVTGALFKAGQGNLNSMIALLGIPLGGAAVAHGPLVGLNKSLATRAVTTGDGAAPTLSTVTHTPFWVLSLVIALVAAALLAWLVGRARKARKSNITDDERTSLAARILTRPWRPWQSGIAIGILASAAYLSSAASGRNYPLGATEGVVQAQTLVTDKAVELIPYSMSEKSPPGEQAENQSERKKVVVWMVVLVASLVAGSHVSARLRGSFRLLPKPPDEMMIAFAGGLMVGAGAVMARGCMIGHVMSGFAHLSLGSLLFGAVVLVFNWMTTWIYLMGGLQRN